MARTEPVRLSTPGKLPDQFIVFPLPEGDEFATATAVVKDGAEDTVSGVTISSCVPSTEDIELNEETIPAGRALQFTVEAAAALDEGDLHIWFTFATVNGIELTRKKRLLLRNALASDDEEIEF